MNKIKFEQYGDLVDQVFSKFNESSISSQDLCSQTENDETSGAEYPNENDSEDKKKKKKFCNSQFSTTNITRS